MKFFFFVDSYSVFPLVIPLAEVMLAGLVGFWAGFFVSLFFFSPTAETGYLSREPSCIF